MQARKFYDADGNEIVGDPSKDRVDVNPVKPRVGEQRVCDADDAGPDPSTRTSDA